MIIYRDVYLSFLADSFFRAIVAISNIAGDIVLDGASRDRRGGARNGN